MLGDRSHSFITHPKKTFLGDKFLVWHSWMLLGYALCGRGFSYFGIAPAYIGEITLIFGLVTLSINKSILKIIKLPQTWFLILFMLWCSINTIPYFSKYGLYTFRDAAIWYYSFFALIVATLLVGRPQRLLFMVEQYKIFSKIFIIIIPVLWVVSKGVQLPIMPGSRDIEIITLKPADTLTHLSAIATFFISSNLLQFKPILFILMFLINLGVVIINANRAGSLAFLNVFTLLSITNYRKSKIWQIMSFVLFIILLCFIINPELFQPLITKINSIFIDNKERQGTKTFRLAWWNYIINYTFFGDYFWTGKGFGINLATDSGFDPLGDGFVRSPHNGHITILARTGVPGLVLWLLVQLSWAGGILFKYYQCRVQKQLKWAGIFLTLLTYWVAAMTVTTFEVVIEGPTGGIWIWTMYGVGLAAMKIYQRYPQILY
ncbi:O-antigen ligase [Calothrix sp. PCC 7507]|uniref:O-antigen ligase family protein n=1 Tax=Calothrix sp. PCC 7507 TaxID=99598 RepID=UPI00029F08F3|nr:O-antigen ligase family protein [Calothrix sp. PCC 7507]AFY34484.1 O-antigen polymerase [Calothrix sp. PCC 7507]